VTIRHIYDVAEESGNWYVTRDGDPIRNYVFRAQGEARRTADRLATSNNLWYRIFEIEYPIAVALRDTPWPYGATCTNTGTPDNPEWTLTEPYRHEEEVTRIIHPDPTGYVQLSVHTRDVYERACMIAGIKPDTDDKIAEEFGECEHGHHIPDDIEPIEAVKIRLAYRRSAGIMIEYVIDQNRRADLIQAAGLMLDRYDREQYEKACEIMDTPVLTDRQVGVVVTMHFAGSFGINVTSPDVPTDYVTCSLAQRRALGIAAEQGAKADMDTGDEPNTGDDGPDTTT